jgi:cephalosporin hydroxylase
MTRMSVGRVGDVLREGGPSLLLRKAAAQTRTRLTVVPASRALRRQIRRTSEIDEALDVAFDFEYDRLSVRPQQIRSEITALLQYLRQRPPRTVVEIGTASGGTLLLLASVAAADATLVTVDLPRHFNRQRLHRAVARSRQSVHTIRADSHTPEARASILEALGGRSVDFLLIDGDHSYEGVKADYEGFAPLVGKGGSICFHDIVPGPEESVGGVPAFWQEVKQGKTTREFVEDWRQGGLGIGLIEVA